MPRTFKLNGTDYSLPSGLFHEFIPKVSDNFIGQYDYVVGIDDYICDESINIEIMKIFQFMAFGRKYEPIELNIKDYLSIIRFIDMHITSTDKLVIEYIDQINATLKVNVSEKLSKYIDSYYLITEGPFKILDSDHTRYADAITFIMKKIKIYDLYDVPKCIDNVQHSRDLVIKRCSKQMLQITQKCTTDPLSAISEYIMNTYKTIQCIIEHRNAFMIPGFNKECLIYASKISNIPAKLAEMMFEDDDIKNVRLLEERLRISEELNKKLTNDNKILKKSGDNKDDAVNRINKSYDRINKLYNHALNCMINIEDSLGGYEDPQHELIKTINNIIIEYNNSSQ
jgi:hypothetical protein